MPLHSIFFSWAEFLKGFILFIVTGSMIHQGLAGQEFPPTSPVSNHLISALRNWIESFLDIPWTSICIFVVFTSGSRPTIRISHPLSDWSHALTPTNTQAIRHHGRRQQQYRFLQQLQTRQRHHWEEEAQKTFQEGPNYSARFEQWEFHDLGAETHRISWRGRSRQGGRESSS